MLFPIEQFVGKADFGNGNSDHSWSIQFNRGGVSAAHPRWGENIEVYFDTNGSTAGGNRLIEKNWDYTSIDGLTSYRPFNFNVNIDTHDAEMWWKAGLFYITHRNGAVGSQDALRVVSSATTDSNNVSMAGRLLAIMRFH